MEQLIFSAETITCTNKRNMQKPNEDVVVADVDNGIYILVDGITRPHSEYSNTSETSAALMASQIFAKVAHEYILAHLREENKERLLRDAAAHANLSIKQFRSKKSLEEWNFYPATLGIVALIDKGVLHYLAVGDCIGVLLRSSSRMLFAKEFAMDGVDLIAPTKSDRYEKYCNHQPEFLAYSVFNGDSQVHEHAEYSYFHIAKGDVIMFATDGLSDLVKFEKQNTLRSATVEELILISKKYDVSPFAHYADDKSMIRVSVK